MTPPLPEWQRNGEAGVRRWIGCALLLGLAGCSVRDTSVTSVNNVNVVTMGQASAARVALLPPGPLVGHELRKLRLAEEAAIISRTGHPLALPTGLCDILVAPGPGGTLAGAPAYPRRGFGAGCGHPLLISKLPYVTL